jgi:hypothetical protein
MIRRDFLIAALGGAVGAMLPGVFREWRWQGEQEIRLPRDVRPGDTLVLTIESPNGAEPPPGWTARRERTKDGLWRDTFTRTADGTEPRVFNFSGRLESREGELIP